MRIAFSAIAVYPGAAGIGRYAANAAWSLIRHAEGIDLVLLARDGSEFERSDLPQWVTVVSCRPTGPLWEQFQVPGILERHGVDLYHSPLFMVPVAKACRQLSTVHDVIPEVLPDQTPPDFLELHRKYFGPSLRAADGVVTVSEYSKRDIVETLGLDGRKVHVAYQALEGKFTVGAAKSVAEAVRGKLSLPDTFILYVGSIEPRKNTFRLIDAFSLAARKRPELHLVIAGRRLFKDYDPVAYAAQKGLSDRVRYVGYVEDSDLPGLYGAASAFAFPSAYEGFGLPVAEAMACGCPVVTSPNSSLPEAGGDAALYVDPDDVEAFAEMILCLLDDKQERERRIELGLRHAACFTPARFAAELAAIYRQVVEGDGR